MHCSANVDDARPRRDLLRALGHGQDDALRRPRALADRRRRARLGRQRDLQLRGRLLREGDPPLAPRPSRRSTGRRTRFGTILENVVVDENGVLDLDDDSKTENTRAAYKLEQIANALPDEAGRPPERGRHAHRRRVRDPAADRAADPRPGDVLLPLRLHGEGRRDGDRRHRAAGDVLDLLRRAVPAAAAGGVRADARREARRAPARDGLAREHGLDGRAVRRGPPDADRGDARAAPRGARRRAARASSTATDPVFGFEVPVAVPGVDDDAARPALDVGATRRRTTARPPSSRGCSARTSSSSRTSAGDRGRPRAGPRGS